MIKAVFEWFTRKAKMRKIPTLCTYCDFALRTRDGGWVGCANTRVDAPFTLVRVRLREQTVGDKS